MVTMSIFNITVRFFLTSKETAMADLGRVRDMPDAVRDVVMRDVRLGYMGIGWVYMLMSREVLGKTMLDVWADQRVPVSYTTIYNIYRMIQEQKFGVFKEMQKLYTLERKAQIEFNKKNNSISMGVLT